MKKVFFGGLKNHWKDYILVLICGIFMVTIIFLSNSLSDCLQWIIDGQTTGNAEESYSFFDFSITYLLLVFMMILIIFSYIRKRSYDYVLLDVMGIQKRHKYIFIGCEYLGIVVISILGGILFGAILSEIIKIELEKIFANIIFTEINYGFSPFRMTIIIGFCVFGLLFIVFDEAISCLGMDSLLSCGKKSGKPVKTRPKVFILGMTFMFLAYISLWFYWGKAKDDLWQYITGVPTPSNKFDTSFNIVGEEEKILTGVFGNKISEHIIVFSDSYYQKVCNRVEGPNLIVMVQIPKNYEKVIEEICAYTNGSGIVYEKKNLLLQISKTKIINVSAAIINIFVLLICSFFVLSIKMECDFPEQKGKYIFYSQGGMTHRNIRKSIMKESFWTGGIPIIFGVVISTIFMGTEVYLKKLSLEWIKQYAVKLMGTITGIIFLFLFISICFGIRNIIRIEREE